MLYLPFLALTSSSRVDDQAAPLIQAEDVQVSIGKHDALQVLDAPLKVSFGMISLLQVLPPREELRRMYLRCESLLAAQLCTEDNPLSDDLNENGDLDSERVRDGNSCVAKSEGGVCIAGVVAADDPSALLHQVHE